MNLRQQMQQEERNRDIRIDSMQQVSALYVRSCDDMICTWEAFHPVSMPDEKDYVQALLLREEAIRLMKEVGGCVGRPLRAEYYAEQAQKKVVEADETLRSLYRKHMPSVPAEVSL